MPGHVDHVIDPAQDTIVAISGLHCAIVTEVRPVMPVLALRVFAVLAVVGCDVAVRISPDRLEDSRPRVADADIPGPAGAGWDLLSVLVQNHGKNPGYRRAGAAGFHGIQCRLGTAQEPTIFRLPPS